jgi:hypothetical protein
MKTIKKIITIGMNEGYNHTNDSNTGSMEELYQKVAQKHFDESGLYISALISPAKVIYSQEWGCPDGGEEVYKIETTANPEFVKDLGKWRCTVKEIALELKNELKQSTVTIETVEVGLTYLT